MELENTVFFIVPMQFLVVRIAILFIQISNTVQNTSYFVMNVHVFLLISWDFAKFYWLCSPVQFFGRFREIPEGLLKESRS